VAHKSWYLLIAMWLWCVAAAGETLPVTTQMVDAGSGAVLLRTPCNWDKDVARVGVFAVYAKPGSYTDVRGYSIMERESRERVPITPVSVEKVDDVKLRIAFPPNLQRRKGDDKYLYHLEVDVNTTGEPCKQGFGFGFR